MHVTAVNTFCTSVASWCFADNDDDADDDDKQLKSQSQMQDIQQNNNHKPCTPCVYMNTITTESKTSFHFYFFCFLRVTWPCVS